MLLYSDLHSYCAGPLYFDESGMIDRRLQHSAVYWPSGSPAPFPPPHINNVFSPCEMWNKLDQSMFSFANIAQARSEC